MYPPTCRISLILGLNFLLTGLTWEEAKQRCPKGVVPACHNSIDTVTISGPADSITEFVEELKTEGVFAKEVKSGGVAFHSYFMAKTAPSLKAALEKVEHYKTFNLTIQFLALGVLCAMANWFSFIIGNQGAKTSYISLGQLIHP